MTHSRIDTAATCSPRLLIAEGNRTVALHLRKRLTADFGLAVDAAHDGREALHALERRPYNLLLTDLVLPHTDGLQLIHEVEIRSLPVTSIAMSGHASVDAAVQAMRIGAFDFVPKPLDMERLELIVQRALRDRALRDKALHPHQGWSSDAAFPFIVTRDARMRAVLELVRDVAATSSTVLIEGETGTGKELIARALHQASAAFRPGPLVVLNCAALPESLLESEMFGHEKGAFTGAQAQRSGRFEQADGGTLFIDELGEVPLSMQVKLLRVLEERRFERVGGYQGVQVDVRVVAATNRCLARLVKKGTFREDLYYRLNVVRLELPPLRERRDDVPLLVRHFCARFARPDGGPKDVSPAALDALVRYPWPGNVRELQNVIERACVLFPGDRIEREQLPPELVQGGGTATPFAVDVSRPLPEVLSQITRLVERRYIRKALIKARGHVAKCAQICGVSRRSITSKLAQYKIKRDKTRGPAKATRVGDGGKGDAR